MSYEFNVRNFVNQLANDSTWTSPNLPKWASDQLSSIPSLESSTADVTSLRIDYDIQKIQKLILAKPELIKHDSYCRNVQTVLQKLKLFRTQVFNSNQTQNSTNSNASTTDSLEGLIHRVQEVWRSTQTRAKEVWAFSKLAEHREQQSYWQSIFQENLTSHILLIIDKKDPAEVLTLLVKAIECKDNQAIKDCLNFIEENNHQKSLVGIPALKDLFNKQEVSDFSIVVANNTNSNSNQNVEDRIYVNKAILSAHSPYFSHYFSSPWSLKGKESVLQENSVDGKREDILALIQYFYTGNISLTADNVSFLLEQAHVWQLSQLTKLCETWLVDHFFPEDLLKFYAGNGHLFCTEGIVKTAVHEFRLRSLSADNYQENFLFAEQMKDNELQEKMLQYLTLRFLASISFKTKPNSNSVGDATTMYCMAFSSQQKRIEVQEFLRAKGHLMRNFDLGKLPSINLLTRLDLLQKIVELFPNLLSLDLSERWSNLTASEMNELAKLTNLLSLKLYGTNDFNILMSLDKLSQLQELTLHNQYFGLEQQGVSEYHQEMVKSGIASPDVNASDFAKTSLVALFSSGLPNLRKLDLSRCKGINLILKAMEHNPNLRELKLSYSDAYLETAVFLAGIPTLEKLDLSNCALDFTFWHFYSQNIDKNGQALKELNIKNVQGCRLKGTLRKFTKLEKLWLGGQRTNELQEILEELVKIPTLRELRTHDLDFVRKSLSFLIEHQKEGLLKAPVKTVIFNGLSPSNYQDSFLWAEKINDTDLQEKILQYLAGQLPKIRAGSLNSNETDLIVKFLEQKGYLLKSLNLDSIQMGALSRPERLQILQDLSRLFPNLSCLNLVKSETGSNNETLIWGWTKQLTIDEIKEIANLKNLTELHITKTDSLASLKELAALKKLEVISFKTQNFGQEEETNVQDSLGALFSEMPRLRKVNFSQCQNVDLVLSALKSHQFLQELNLSESDLTDKSCQYLLKMSSLQKLDISSCDRITSDFLKTLSSSEKILDLKDLDIRNSFESEKIFLGAYLKVFSNLKQLKLGGQRIEDSKQLLGIEEIPTLRKLWISGGDLIKGAAFLSELQGLQKLHIEGQINDIHIESAVRIPGLRNLEIPRYQKLTNENWSRLQALVQLNGLSLTTS